MVGSARSMPQQWDSAFKRKSALLPTFVDTIVTISREPCVFNIMGRSGPGYIGLPAAPWLRCVWRPEWGGEALEYCPQDYVALAGTFYVIGRWSRDDFGCDGELSPERVARAELPSLAFVVLICLVLYSSRHWGRSNMPRLAWTSLWRAAGGGGIGGFVGFQHLEMLEIRRPWTRWLCSLWVGKWYRVVSNRWSSRQSPFRQDLQTLRIESREWHCCPSTSNAESVSTVDVPDGTDSEVVDSFVILLPSLAIVGESVPLAVGFWGFWIWYAKRAMRAPFIEAGRMRALFSDAREEPAERSRPEWSGCCCRFLDELTLQVSRPDPCSLLCSLNSLNAAINSRGETELGEEGDDSKSQLGIQGF